MKKNVRCAVIGQHPLRFPWGFDEEDNGCRRMKLEMAQRIMELRHDVLHDPQRLRSIERLTGMRLAGGAFFLTVDCYCRIKYYDNNY